MRFELKVKKHFSLGEGAVSLPLVVINCSVECEDPFFDWWDGAAKHHYVLLPWRELAQ